MDISPAQLKKFDEATSITEIQMMFGRFATLMDEMNAIGIYEELFATDDPGVSVEYTSNGRYEGPSHARLFFEDLHKKLNDPADKRGWMDFTDGVTPNVVVADSGDYAWASWLLFGPKAKVAAPYGSHERTLTAFWYGGKMYWELKRIDGNWKILHFQQATYLSSPYDEGWVRQPECWRETPIWDALPDSEQRFYTYNPDRVYAKGSPQNWGPYVPRRA